MKLCLASERHERDGRLWISRDGGRHFSAAPVDYTTLRAALESWEGFIEAVCNASAETLRPVASLMLDAVLPRCPQALYASAFGNRAIRVDQQCDEESPDAPGVLMYQGASDKFLGPGEAIQAFEPLEQLDMEAEIAVLVDDVPMGVSVADAAMRIRLVLGVNDFTYRTLVKREKATGFGFVQGKPLSGVSAYAVTPSALGPLWADGRLHAHAVVRRNGAVVGRVPTSGMQLGFPELVAHAAAKRPLAAGTLISSGTVSSADGMGAASLIEIRQLEQRAGSPPSSFLLPGDTIDIRFEGPDGESLFGPLSNPVMARQ